MSGTDPDLFHALFEATPDAIVIADRRGRIVHTNAAAAALLGYSEDDLVRMQIDDLVPVRFRDHARQRAGFHAEGRPRAMGRGLELFARHADGHDIPVDISLTTLRAHDPDLVACVIRDLRGRAHGLDNLRVQATALRSAANGIVITDVHGVIAWVNPAACAITGYASDELIGSHTRLLKSGRHDDAFYRELWTTVLRGETWSSTMINRRKDGTEYHEQQTIAPVLDDHGNVTHFIAIKQDVSEQRRIHDELARAHAELAALNLQLAEQALRDPLTGLHNRRYLAEAWPREVSRARRADAPIAVAVLDVDRFKQVNDRHGHVVGDAVLVALADVLRARCRDGDLVCRLGGEEFVVVMPGASLDTAARRIDELRVVFADHPVATADAVVTCTLSAGVVVAGADGDLDASIARADGAMYRAKAQGRNRVEIAPG